MPLHFNDIRTNVIDGIHKLFKLEIERENGERKTIYFILERGKREKTKIKNREREGEIFFIFILERNERPKNSISVSGSLQGSWRILNGDHRRWIQSAFNLSDAHFGNFCEHSGTFNCLKAGLTALHHSQNGEGVVAVSPRYGDRLRSKHSIFWAARKVSGILNAVDPGEKPQIDVINIAQWKREGKEWIQQKFGLRITSPEGPITTPCYT